MSAIRTSGRQPRSDRFIAKNVGWNLLTFHTEEIDRLVDGAGKSLVDQRISFRQFGVT
jgi:hypothetical protein